MPPFFHGLSSNWLAYILGFLSGIIFIWFINVAKEVLYKTSDVISEKRRKSQEDYLLTAESIYRNITYHYAQSLHLFSHLFPLDKICIEPTMLIPPPQVQPGEFPFFSDIVSTTIPYLPEWPEMAMHFGTKTITLAQVLEQENISRVAILGRAGSGKTTALAHFASILCKGEPCTKKLEEYLPILVHIGEISLDNGTDPVENLIIAALSRISTPPNTQGIKTLLNAKCRQGKAILLLDGIDELPPLDIDRTVKYLKSLLEYLPTLKIVTTASLEYFNGLRELGFLFLPIACWKRTQRSRYIKRWVEIWDEINDNNQANFTDPLTNEWLLLERWINHYNPYADPLTLTLILWSTLNNSLLGAKKIEAIESFIRCHCDPKVRPLAEKLAKQQLLSQCPIFTIENLERISPTLLGSLPELIKSGLVKQYHTQKICFIHPILASHLATCDDLEPHEEKLLCQQRDWEGKENVLSMLAAKNTAPKMLQDLIAQDDDPICSNLMRVGRWLVNIQGHTDWRTLTLRKLVEVIKSETYPLRLRASALTAILIAGETPILYLLHQFSKSSQSDLRYLSCLGFGMNGDPHYVEVLKPLLDDPDPLVAHAACLSLVAIGDRSALESVATLLLNGNEEMRRAAAEALANNEEEGHEALRDGCTIDDPLTRRACIFGLMRIREAWIKPILEHLQYNDSDWLVRNAAEQALFELSQPLIHWIDPNSVLRETPWLIEFASKRDMGIASEKSALDVLHLALKEGNYEQRLSALNQLLYRGGEESVGLVLEILHEKQRGLQEIASLILWYFARSGVAILSPNKGLGYDQ